MKLNTKPAVFFIAMILGVIMSLAGCATTGMQRSKKAGTTMKTVEYDINQAVAQVNATGASLEDLVKPGQSNMKKAFRKYSDNVDKMEDVGTKLFEHIDKMSTQGKEYFEEWRTQGEVSTNPQIQSLSEQRRADLRAIFVRIAEASIGVKGPFKAYISDIREIQVYFSNDLTPKGVEAITAIARKAVNQGDSLKDTVNPLLSAIGNARTEWTEGGTK